VEWFFDGVGTMLIGFALGGVGGTAVTWRVMSVRHSQTQRSRNNATQVQAGRDIGGSF
jgi:hypothetical protein